MSQATIPTVVGTLILLVGGMILLWGLTSRIARSGLRKLLRIVALPVFLILIGVFSFVMARSQVTLLPQAQTILTASETMTVQPGTMTQTLNETGSLTPSDETTLTFGASAPVTELDVEVGDSVHAGDVLARVDTTAIDAQIRNAQINLTQAQNSLTALTAPASDLDVKIAQASVTVAQASLSAAAQTGSSATDVQIAQLQVELAKNQLWQAQLSNGISQSNQRGQASVASQIQTAASLAQSATSVDAAQISADATANNGASQSALASADAQLISAQAALDSLLSGPNDSELRQAQIAVQTAQFALDSAQKLGDEAVLTAPFDGVVASVDIVEGAIPPSTGAITLIDTNQYTITLSVDEKDIPSLKVGQTVNVSVQALDNATFAGTVTHIDPTGASANNLVTYSVEVTLDSNDQPLRPGMSAVATVVLSELDDVLIVPNRFITTDATTQHSTVKVETAPGVYTSVPVVLGAQSDTESVISSGVSAGQTLVILSSGGTSTSTTQQSGGLGLLGAVTGGGGGAGGAPPSGGVGAPPSGGGPGG